MSDLAAGRNDLIEWNSSRSTNFFDASPTLGLELAARRVERVTIDHVREFGATVAGVIEPSVATLERHRDLPRLIPYDAVGRRIDVIEFHPAHYVATSAAWASGVVRLGAPGDSLIEQAGLFYLLSFVGEGGVACPAVCTVGLGRALAHRGSDEQRRALLPRIRTDDASQSLRGSQFLTEVHGGSDVGANALRAVPDAVEGDAWRLSGEKWFCSVADADLFVVTARPDGAAPGTRGLGCFLVPRTLDGTTPNGFRIRQLKDKLGTRCLASAEMDFDAALAWPIGDVDAGFRVAVEELLNTSRWLNAVGSCGLMARAYLEASSFSRHRRAFGSAIGGFPAMREQIAAMKVDAAGALASTMALTTLMESLESGSADDRERAVYRFLVNANKYVTSVRATDVVHRGIEVLGGNGTIESFSALPRLYRDSVVYESWEGTHNVLCAQVQRDVAKLGLLNELRDWVTDLVSGVDSAESAAIAASLGPAIDVASALAHAGAPALGEFRRSVERLVTLVQAAALVAHCANSERAVGIASHFVELRVTQVARPLAVDAALGGDCG